jgi:ankyrin repeat protein
LNCRSSTTIPLVLDFRTRVSKSFRESMSKWSSSIPRSTAVQGRHYRFALTATAVGADIQTINILLDYSAMLNACDQENETALHGAVCEGSIEMVQHLLDKSINPDIRGEQGTALEMAVNLEQQEPGSRAETIKI